MPDGFYLVTLSSGFPGSAPCRRVGKVESDRFTEILELLLRCHKMRYFLMAPFIVNHN